MSIRHGASILYGYNVDKQANITEPDRMKQEVYDASSFEPVRAGEALFHYFKDDVRLVSVKPDELSDRGCEYIGVEIASASTPGAKNISPEEVSDAIQKLNIIDDELRNILDIPDKENASVHLISTVS